MNHVAIFRFRLSGGHSIGRAALQTIWSAACRSNDVSVGRENSGPAVYGEPSHIYSLYGPPRMPNGSDIERRLHDSLAAALPKATIAITRL